ncbi:MAG: BamA/TamA family outer membrane protein [Candidatus Aegiribacteria sp.]|nr:BamA/TamA family outer membrane protein [Candidatus Aegiribacteria sp.]
MHLNTRIVLGGILLFLLPEPLQASFVEPEVDSIIVSGDISVSQSKLLHGTGLKPGSSLLRITPVEVQNGIVSNLSALGYLSSTVDVQWPLWDDETAIVRISVDTGMRSLLSGLVFKGITLFSADSLANLYPGATYEPVTPEDTLAFRNAVLNSYSERGYINASLHINLLSLSEIEGRTGANTGYRAVECVIDENNQVFLGSVTVTGLETVREKVITRELMISHGDSLNMELLRQSIRLIYHLGLFQDVRFSYHDCPDDSSIVNLFVAVTESRYHRIDLGTGYISPSAVFGSTRWLHPNIMGNNQRLTIGFHYMEYFGSNVGRKIEPEITYEEPWFLSTRWRWQLKLGYLNLSIPGLFQRSYSITSSFARNITDHLKFIAGYSLEYEKYIEEDQENAEWYTTSSVTSSLIHDTRSPLLNPFRGHWMMAEGKLSGSILGGADYYRFCNEARWFIPFGDDFVLAMRMRSGVAFPYGDDVSVPPDDRFFMGGGTTVRGYPFNSLGPKDSNDNPIGGRVEILSNFEARARIIGSFGLILFTDVGGLWNSMDNINLESTGFGVGVGLRYNTIFGPIRVDYGFAPTWSNSLKRGKFYFGLGHAF